MTSRNLASVLVVLLSLSNLGCGCSETGLGGDTETDGDTSTDGSVDLPADRPADWVPEPGTGTLVPEGEATFYESDVGEALSTFSGQHLPIAFSGDVYTLLVEEAVGEDGIAAYRLVRGGTTLTSIWFDDVFVPSPSICWTGEVFTALFPIRDVGNRVLTITEEGEHVRTEIVSPFSGSDWMTGEVAQILCPSSGPLIVDFILPGGTDTMDQLHLLNADGTAVGTDVEVDLPRPSSNGGWKPGCSAVGDAGACLTGSPPADKMKVVFFDREGTVWESGALPDSAFFSMGGAIVDVGGAAAVVWADRPEGGSIVSIGYCLMGLDGEFIVPPMATEFEVESYDEEGLAAASSGSDILVVGPTPNERGAEFGTYLYLLDLAGNPLDEPVRLEPLLELEASTTVFWEGDAYALIWNENEGIWYRRYRVE